MLSGSKSVSQNVLILPKQLVRKALTVHVNLFHTGPTITDTRVCERPVSRGEYHALSYMRVAGRPQEQEWKCSDSVSLVSVGDLSSVLRVQCKILSSASLPWP